jgi:glycine/D-amino acid oxidase-like deaminating enzyme
VLTIISHAVLTGSFMPNLYRDTAECAARLPRLDTDARADVLIVGGGITGLSTALQLAERGASVVLLEAEEPGFGASGRNGGQVNPGLKYDPDTVERDFGADLGRRMNVLAGDAPQFVFDLIERLHLNCEARRNGTLRAAAHENHAARVRVTAEQWRNRHAPVELVGGAALEQATGTAHYRAAMWDRRGGDLNPLLYARGLSAAALRAGARLHGGTRATRVSRAGREWRVATATGSVTAAHVVLATNGYTDDLWPGLRRTLVPVFGAVAASAPLPRAVAESVMPGRAVLYESGAITVYYRVDSGQRLLIGGRGPMREIESTDSIRHLLLYAEKLWPALRGVAWPHAWGGRLAMTRDAYPHVHEPAPGVLICLGYNGRGVAMATTMGAQLANRILNPAGGFDMPISSMKPMALHALWPLAVRAAILRGRVSDSFGL